MIHKEMRHLAPLYKVQNPDPDSDGAILFARSGSRPVFRKRIRLC
jgi:hypothetical protein